MPHYRLAGYQMSLHRTSKIWGGLLMPRKTPAPAKPKPPDGPQAATPAPTATAEQDFDNLKRKEKPLRDVSTIKKLKDLVDALKADFGMEPQEAMKELNIKGWVDLAMTPADAYIQIRATKS